MSTSEGKWDQAFRWVEATMGGRITWLERQGRSRPAWFIDVDVGGKTIPLYWRGYRGDLVGDQPPIYSSLEREAKLLQILEGAGVPVPHVYGFCQDPMGILMERAPGRPDFHHIADEEKREAIAHHFMEVLASIHSIDPDVFTSIGMVRPTTPEEQALNDLNVHEKAYRRLVTEPVPLVEFTLRWLHRNVPKKARRTVLVQGDTGPGNFLSQNGRVTAVLDWELAHLGDPMYDLALIRGRDLCTPFGDLRKRFQLYSEFSGDPIDLEALRYYSVRGMLITPMALAPVIQNPVPWGDMPEFLSWYVLYSRATVECLAEAIGIELEPVSMPEPVPTPRSPMFDVVLENLRDEQLPQIDDGYRAYRMRTTIRLLEHLRLSERLGPAIDALELDDLARLLGHRPSSLAQGDAELQQLVLGSGPERDAELVRYFYRRVTREETLLKPAMEEMAMSTLSPIE